VDGRRQIHRHDLELKGTQGFREALAADPDMGIPISELMQVVKDGDPSRQGAWADLLVLITVGRRRRQAGQGAGDPGGLGVWSVREASSRR
jgi:hypothetical protein